MSQSLEQFAVSADGYTFPAEDVLTGRGFITGKSGSGKSNTASVIIEELLDRQLGLLIVDTDGEYRGLLEEYDLLHVGADDDCDFALSSKDASKLTSFALEDQVPILLDISTYPDEEQSEGILYEVINALFVAEGDFRIPFLILLEEAHEFIPQRGGRVSKDLKQLLVRVAKRGRKRGLGICCLSQRPAAVDKDYITQCDWFVWHRLTWENDTDVVGRILGDEAEIEVQSLNDGEAIVMTDWDESITRVQFRRKRTEDAGSTPSLSDLDFSRTTSADRLVDEALGSENDDDSSNNDSVEKSQTDGQSNESTATGESTNGDDGSEEGDSDEKSTTTHSSTTAQADDSTTADGTRQNTDPEPNTSDRSPESSQSDATLDETTNESEIGAGSTTSRQSGDQTGATGNTKAVEQSTGATTSPANEPDPSTDEQYLDASYVSETSAGPTADAVSNTITTTSPDRQPAKRPDRQPAKTVAYDEGNSVESSGFERKKPSFQHRRERHETPSDTTDPIWEIGAMIVYLYDFIVWYHLYAAYVIETTLLKYGWRAQVSSDAVSYQRGPGPLERFAYRTVAILSICLGYVALIAGILFVM